MKQEKKPYIVIWHYMANYGFNEVNATNPQQAIKEHLFYKRKDIELFAYENNKKTSAYKPKQNHKVRK